MGRIVFVTATDTNAGKTLLTALLLAHLRSSGCHALAMKPFSSGSWHDVRVLLQAQSYEISQSVAGPFHFPEPLAPLLAARRAGCSVSADDVLRRIRSLAAQCEVLFVEGAGGLCSPLGEGFTAADLIQSLRCPVLVAARNRLGVINHVLLTLSVLRELSVETTRVILMGAARSSLASETNPALLRELAAPAEITNIPFLGARPTSGSSLRRRAKKLKKSLAQIAETAIVSSAFGGGDGRREESKKHLRERGN